MGAGIVVDTFSQLRGERQDKENDMLGTCFICSLSSHEFDTVGGFAKHVRKDHNMWAYMYFAAVLENTIASERNYNEAYLHKMFVEDRDPSAFPVNRSMRLSTRKADIEDVLARVMTSQGHIQQELDRQFDALRGLLRARRAGDPQPAT